MANSFIVYPNETGSTRDYSVPFEYLSTEFVKATVDGTPVPFSFLSTYMIRFNTAPAGVLKIYRETKRGDLINTYINGSILVDDQLNTSFWQSLHISEEVFDSSLKLNETGSWGAENLRLVDLPAPVDAKDAVNKAYLDQRFTADKQEVDQNRQLAQAAAQNAASSESAAAASASSASASRAASAASESAAAASESAAASSASSAASSKSAAASSASSALSSKNAAAASASAASSSEINAKASENAAASSASSAASDAATATSAASTAVTAFEDLDDRYLGAKSSDPSVGNDGGPLEQGVLHFNTSASVMKVWNGTAWEAAYVGAGNFLLNTGGTMTGTLRFGKALGQTNLLIDLQQGFGVYSDNESSPGNKRLWFNSDAGADMIFGPRGGADVMARIRVRADQFRMDGTGGDIMYVSDTSFYYKGKRVWHEDNDGTGSGLDADRLRGLLPNVSNVPNTVVSRDGNGYIRAELFNMAYTGTNSDVSRIITQQTGDGWLRPSTPAQVAAALEPHLSLGNEVYNGSSTGNTNFPIGHIVATNGIANRNQSVPIGMPSSGSSLYVTSGIDIPLDGIWRCRGRTGELADGTAVCGIFQRVG